MSSFLYVVVSVEEKRKEKTPKGIEVLQVRSLGIR